MEAMSYHDALNNIIFRRPAISNAIPGLAMAGIGYSSEKNKIRNAILGGLVGGIAPHFINPNIDKYSLGGGTIGAGLGYYLGDDKLFSTLLGGLAGAGIGTFTNKLKNYTDHVSSVRKNLEKDIKDAYGYIKKNDDEIKRLSDENTNITELINSKGHTEEELKNLEEKLKENEWSLYEVRSGKENNMITAKVREKELREYDMKDNDWKEFKKRLTTPKHLGNIGIGLAGGGAIGAGLGYLSGDTKEDKKNKALIGAMIGSTLGGIGGYLY